jgi:hypothetical protein
MTPIGQPYMCGPMTWLDFVFVQSVFVFVGRPSRRVINLRLPEHMERAQARKKVRKYV